MNQEEQIQRYLRGKMSAEELESFQRTLGTDAALQQKVWAAGAEWSPEKAAAAVQNTEGMVLEEPTTSERTGILPNEIAPVKKRGPWLAIILCLAALLIGVGVYRRFAKPKPDFQTYFTPPKSLLADFEARSAGGGTVENAVRDASSPCARLVAQADEAYLVGDYDEAQEPLLLIVLDENGQETTGGGCASDGYFYLGLLRMRLGDPQTAIQCFTKVEDIDRYGEDIQWFMTLAFVQLAEQQPDVREQAARALNRILKSAQPADRKDMATSMLQKLGG